MKKNTLALLILLCFFFNIIHIIPVSAATTNVFKEGIYKAADFNFSPKSSYYVQNISNTDSIHVFLFDENRIEIQAILLEPQSKKYNLLTLKPDYRIVVVGNGDAYIDTY